METKRKKLGGTPMATLKGQESAVHSAVGKNNTRAGFLDVDKGWNKFRMFPAHPGCESFMYALVRYFLPIDQKDDNGKVERKKKAVFNSKVHGGTEKDLVEEYLKYLTTVTLSHLDSASLTAQLKPLAYGGDYNLQPKTEWVSYANKYNKQGKKLAFGRFSITPGTKVKMEKLSATEGADETIVIDPFTDEEDGIAIILTYDPDAKDAKGHKDNKNFYNVELEQKQVTKFKIELIPTPLDEKEIEEFLKAETLESMYKNSYTLKDFNLALQGIQNIDRELKFGVLQDSNFIEIVEEIRAYYPEEGEEEKDDIEENLTEVEGGDDLSSLERPELKKLILNEFGQGVIVIRTNNSEEDIRNMIREKREEIKQQSAIEAEDEIEPEIEPEVEPEAQPEEAKKTNTDDMPFDKKQGEESSTISNMKAKLAERRAAELKNKK
jgi:hypothetical protein